MAMNVSTHVGSQAGPHLLILGGIHGDEPCGTAALAHLKFELDTGILQIKQGILTLVPLCNPAAYSQKRRYIDHNLNRIIGRYEKPACTEETFANSVAELIEAANIVLDLHSYSSGRLPFLFLDRPTPDNVALAKAQGINYWVTGWGELYDQPELAAGPTDTIQYAYRHGKTGILIECGQHKDASSVSVAYRCARQTIEYYGMIDADKLTQNVTPTIIRNERIIRRDKEGKFTQEWMSFDPVKKGTPIIQYDDGTALLAPYDGMVILPDPKADLGHEWIYLGREEPKL